MSGLEVVGSIASVVQLAGVVYSISKQLYEVGSALSNAPLDINDLAHDLEIFSEELLLYSALTNSKSSHLYSSQIHTLTTKIIGRCATICWNINRILKSLRSKSVLARLKWVFKEKEIKKLLERLRDLKLSLIGVLSVLRGLKVDRIIDELGVATPSLLTGQRNMRADERTTKQAEEIRRILEGITMEQYKHGSLSSTNLAGQGSQSSGEMRTSDSREGYRIERARTTESMTVSSISAPGTATIPTSTLLAMPLLSASAVTRVNPIMQNASAIESVQSFHSAVSHLDHTSEGKSLHQMRQEHTARATAKYFNLGNGEATSTARSLELSNKNRQPHIELALQQLVDDDNDNSNNDKTRCICGFEDYPGLKLDEDDGFFLQCNRCRVWQHGGCVGIKRPAYAPEEYSCEECRKDLHRIYKSSNGRRCSYYIPPCEKIPQAPVSPQLVSRKINLQPSPSPPPGHPLLGISDDEVFDQPKYRPSQGDAVLVSFMAGGKYSDLSRDARDKPLASNREEERNPVRETRGKAEVGEMKGKTNLEKHSIGHPTVADMLGNTAKYQAWKYHTDHELVRIIQIETGSIESLPRKDIPTRENYKEGDDITIVIDDKRDGSRRYFSLSPKTTFDKVYRAHCQHSNVDAVQTQMFFEGSMVFRTDTCDNLAIETGDIIEAHWMQIGGGGPCFDDTEKDREEDREEEHTGKQYSRQRVHSNQLWLRALAELRLQSDGTSDLDCIWTEDIPTEILAQEAMKKLTDTLSNIIAHLQDPMSQGALKSIQRIFEVVKVVESTMYFKTAAVVWVCLQHVLEFLTNCSLDILRMRTPILSQLAEITALVARYTVLGNIYQQWPGMSLDKNFEDSLISLGVFVLRFLEFLVAGKAEPMEKVLREGLTFVMGEINEADKKCRGFSVRILEDGLQHTLDDVEEEEDDLNDMTELRDEKRTIRDIADEERNRHCKRLKIEATRHGVE